MINIATHYVDLFLKDSDLHNKTAIVYNKVYESALAGVNDTISHIIPGNTVLIRFYK